MKKYILNAIAIFTFATGLSSCGDSFLETDNYKGVDLEGGLNTVTNVSTALNGTYYQLFYYAFAGNYALAIGDIPTDIIGILKPDILMVFIPILLQIQILI